MAAKPRTDDVAEMQRKLARTQHLIDKLKMIRVLHMSTYTSSQQVDEIAAEFYYAVGDILEGQTPQDLSLKKIDREAFLKEMKDGS